MSLPAGFDNSGSRHRLDAFLVYAQGCAFCVTSGLIALWYRLNVESGGRRLSRSKRETVSLGQVRAAIRTGQGNNNRAT